MVKVEISKKVFIAVSVVAVLFAVVIVYLVLQYASAVQVKAVVVSQRVRTDPSRESLHKAYYATFQYAYKGKKDKTEHEVRTLTGYDKGSEVRIRIEDSHPDRIVDIWHIKWAVFFEVFAILFLVLLNLSRKIGPKIT